MNKYELLSPAGNIESAYAAINAGADAIYLGVNKFSARAFADNFDTNRLCEVIKTAHLRDVSIYLTLNTLINSTEIGEIKELISPLYEAGLDGTIVQDLGVARIVLNEFPKLELHASTQMSIMSSDGAKMLKGLGYSRVVPSRELTLKEIIQIKKDADVELECFIHGAMCYSYSGLCLMSSMIGGRSGNRGKCAGTCRLPFKVHFSDFESKENEYPLSMKDMCTVQILPELMDAGIDSFKIEGRMKSPEYVAGVTSLYRKYMDMYIRGGKDDFFVDKEDLDRLETLYIRTEISRGYYEGHKGRQLITISSPGYNGNDESYIEYLSNKYVHVPDALKIDISVYAYSEFPLGISITMGDIYVYFEGPICEKASKAPLSEERIREQISKLGGSDFEAREVIVDTSGDVFLPMSVLNEARRGAIFLLEQEILKSYGREI